ncbi:hypothetical protein A4G23_05538 [Streptomyces rubrolavendulae]|uniref:Uncharacterized protein n=1 Tax=Streptomyces rubrolavendulae TaxID=285473 RepID=A0A1D8GB26_9ACTN|nr:hypothetical protein A4G23_05538 [Streptomyces rubrolavendulae]
MFCQRCPATPPAAPRQTLLRPKDEVLLGFEDFTPAAGLDFVVDTEHRPAPLRGKTPLEAWQDDPTPLRDVPATDLWTFHPGGTPAPHAGPLGGIRFRRRTMWGRGERAGRDPGPGPFSCSTTTTGSRSTTRPRAVTWGLRIGRPGHRRTDQRGTAGAGRSRPPSEEGPGGFPAGALRRREPAGGAPAARRADHRAGRGRTHPGRRHRPVGSGDAGPHPARRAPGRLAHPALPRHPDRAWPACSRPARTCPRRPPGSTAQTTEDGDAS